MKQKNKVSCLKFFSFILQNIDNAAPESIIVDFEIGLYTYLCETFLDTKLYGCLFNFSQIIWRKIQNLGFATLYTNN
jgi:hypothetical protein